MMNEFYHNEIEFFFMIDCLSFNSINLMEINFYFVPMCQQKWKKINGKSVPFYDWNSFSPKRFYFGLNNFFFQILTNYYTHTHTLNFNLVKNYFETIWLWKQSQKLYRKVFSLYLLWLKG